MKPIDELAKKDLKYIKPYSPGKPVEEVARELGLSQIFKLASNENPLGSSPKAIQAIRRKSSDLSRYPESSAPLLRRAIAKYLGVFPEEVFLGNGSSEVIALLLQAFAVPGSQVVFPDPSFIIYRILTHTVSARPVAVALNKDFTYDLEAIARAIGPETSVVILCNPNNPTGSLIEKDRLRWFLDRVPPEVIVLLDEAYCDYVESEEFVSGVELFRKHHLLVARTFSKIYGLAGLRIGYGVAQQELLAVLEKIRPPFNTSSLAQEAASAALEDCEFVQRSRNANSRGKKFLAKELKKLGITVHASEANFLMCDLRRPGAEVCKKLEAAGLIIRALPGFGLSDGFVRITIGKSIENRALVQELKKIFQEGK
ncbi:MAG: histidinol-phosphate transaminase [Candidatus Ratteibacteria bacterium]|jgi:histidinol-phosphate aminotransferase